MGVVLNKRGGHAVVSLLICYGLYCVIHVINEPVRVMCVFDEYASLQAQQEISAYVQQHCSDLNVEAVQSIKDQFLCIDSIGIRAIDSTVRVVQCSFSKPFVNVQQDHVVVENGHIIPQRFFMPLAIAPCKRLRLAPHLFDSKCLSFQDIVSLQRVSPDVCKQFDVVWHKSTELYCIDKCNSQHVIIATDTVDAHQLLYNYSSILEKKVEQRKKYAQCIDMRFENQLIVRQMDRGSYEEKIIC